MSAQADRLRKRIAAIPQAVRAGVRPALDKSADELERAMKTLVPVDEAELKNSIAKSDGDTDLEIRVTAGSDDNEGAIHARWVEFGTPESPEQAFFYPSIRLLHKRIQRRIKTAVRKSVRENFG